MVGEEVEVDFLLALVFLNMMLKSRRIDIEEKEKNRKTKGKLQVSTEQYRNNNSI